jgi:hypothetical protein
VFQTGEAFSVSSALARFPLEPRLQGSGRNQGRAAGAYNRQLPHLNQPPNLPLAEAKLLTGRANAVRQRVRIDQCGS